MLLEVAVSPIQFGRGRAKQLQLLVGDFLDGQFGARARYPI